MKIDTQKSLFVCEIKVPALNGKVLLVHSGYGQVPCTKGNNGYVTAYEVLRAFDNSEETELREDGFMYYGRNFHLRRKFIEKDGETFILADQAQSRDGDEWGKCYCPDWHY